jgi:class 3 adenylate cyclase
VAAQTPGLAWTPLGEVTLKGVPEPVSLVRLDLGSVELEQV